MNFNVRFRDLVRARSRALDERRPARPAIGGNDVDAAEELSPAGPVHGPFPAQVLSRSFLTHFPHHKSAARQNWEKNSEAKQKGGDHKARMDALYQEFLAALIATYGRPGGNPTCTTICNS